MNKALIATSLIIISLTLFNCVFAAEPKLTTVNKIVAIVNDDVITQDDLQQQTSFIKKQLQKNNAQLPPTKVLNNLIDNKLQTQLASRANLKISQTELNQAINRIAEQNDMSISQLKQETETQGTSYAEFRKQIKQQLLFAKLQQQIIGPKINVTNAEVKEFKNNYKDLPSSYHIQNILIPIPDSPTPRQIKQAEQQANQIATRLHDGEDFNKVALANSTSLQGGDLGWRQLAELPPVYAKAVKSMYTGDTSKPLRAANGFHIIKLIATRNDENKLSDNQIKEAIFRRKFVEHLQTWLQELRDAAYIKIL